MININYIEKSKRQQEKKEKDAKKRKSVDLKSNFEDINETLVSKINLFSVVLVHLIYFTIIG